MNPKKVLLAEDDMDDQKLFHDFLHHRSDIVLLCAVENGEELLNTLKTVDSEGLPDLIILDQNMPKRNGIQTLQVLKKEERFAEISVVIYSTHTDQQLVNEAIRNGASKVVSKPISKEGYGKMMDDLLKLVGPSSDQ